MSNQPASSCYSSPQASIIPMLVELLFNLPLKSPYHSQDDCSKIVRISQQLMLKQAILATPGGQVDDHQTFFYAQILHHTWTPAPGIAPKGHKNSLA